MEIVRITPGGLAVRHYFDNNYSRSGPRSGQRQRGDVLLEALVGVLVTAIMAAGMARVASQIMSSQYETAVDALLINQMRNTIQIHGRSLCDDASPLSDLKGLPEQLPDGSISLDCDSAGSTVAVVMGGKEFAGELPPRIDLFARQGSETELKVSSFSPQIEGGGQ